MTGRNDTSSTEEDFKSRIGKAYAAFLALWKVWKTREISLKTKLKLYNSNVKLVLLYGCETWTASKSCTRKVQVFYQQEFEKDTEDWTDGKNHKWRSLEESGTENCRGGDRKEKMEMDRAYTEEGKQLNLEEGPWLKPARKKNKRKATTDLEKDSGGRCEKEWKVLEGNKTYLPR